MIIIKYPLTHFIPTLLLSASLCVLSSGAVYAAPLAEQPPPWAARAGVKPGKSVTVPATQPQSIETWYRNRQAQITKAPTVDVASLQNRADKGDHEAQYELGLLLQGRAGTEPDLELAKEWLEVAAEGGHTRAQYALALALRSDSSTENAVSSVQWQEKAAQGGLSEAQYGLGLLYANGQAVQADPTKARYWFEQAAASGHQLASLALVNLSVAGGSEVRAEAALTTPAVSPATPAAPAAPAAPTVSAALEAFESPVSLPELTPTPTPLPKPQQVSVPPTVSPATVASANVVAPSDATAKTLPAAPLDAAVTMSAEPAPEDWVEQVATQPQVEQNTSQVDMGNMSVAQIEAAAKQGDRYAQLMLGALHEDGAQGMQRDMQQAAQWYKKAAEQGYPKAQHNLALLYEDGRGMEQNYKQAAYWYQKAASAGFAESQNNLAVLYIMGSGVTKDRVKAEQLLRAAVAQDNENAKRNLGMLLQNAS